MKYFFVIIISMSFNAFSQDKENFLVAWENLQKSHSEVELFEKTSDKHYKIKFVNIPFEGELVVLAIGVEDMNYYSRNNPYLKSAYIEIELKGASDSMLKKYSRTYASWADGNTLYLNGLTNQWLTRTVFAKNQITQFDENKFKDQYKNYVIGFLLFYFLFVHIRHNRRVKESINRQVEAMDLHDETNKLLKDILTKMKN